MVAQMQPRKHEDDEQNSWQITFNAETAEAAEKKHSRNSRRALRAPRSNVFLPRRDYGQIDEAGGALRVIDALGRLHIVFRFGEKDVGDEGLRVAVIEREPGGLDLHHDPVPGQE